MCAKKDKYPPQRLVTAGGGERVDNVGRVSISCNNPVPGGRNMKLDQPRDSALTTITADDQSLRQNILDADLPALLATVYYLTKDVATLKPEWKPKLEFGVVVSGLTPDEERHVRNYCLDRLKEFRDIGMAAPLAPTYDDVQNVGSWLMDEAIEPSVQLALEEMVVPGQDHRKPRWSKARINDSRPFSVGIIGAGESGLLAAIRLRQAGIPFVIYEKNKDVGGTWLENHYPGCRVDCNSFFYSYAFARTVWNDYYGHAKDVQAYFSQIAKDSGIWSSIEFETEVKQASWREDAGTWELTGDGPSGVILRTHNVLITAVGQLNRPVYPSVAGRETFAGSHFHSSRWDHSVNLAGKRIGVIGTGASAAQFIPQIAQAAAKVTVMARTVSWLLPTPLLQEQVSPGQRWLLDHIPGYAMWYRATLVLPGSIGMLDGAIVEPDYPPTETAVSAKNEAARKAILDWLEPQIADRPDLRPAVLPSSPLGAKRIIRDNGAWVKTLKRDNVEVITTPIDRINERGAIFKDGMSRDFDILIYGTGFQAARFLVPMEITGRKEARLREKWNDDDAAAYLGMTVPGFPNLFILYGPNTNQVVHGGSAIMWTEYSISYVLDAIRILLERDAKAMDVRPEVFRTYMERIDKANLMRAWGFSKVSSWYKNSKGRTTQNFPFTTSELWQRTREVSAADYVIE
jgi:4-hydroxyacetophenone monooxygenase